MGEDDTWNRLLRAKADTAAIPPDDAAGTLLPLFLPLLRRREVVLGRLAQTLDGRIATRCGASQWIGGPGDILHTHRLRALFDAVVVGAGTVAADDPQLTTRLCAGANPVRVVLDPDGRLGTGYRVFRDGPPTLVVRMADQCDDSGRDGSGRDGLGRHGTAEVLALPRDNFLGALLPALRARGLRRIFVEGGGVTVSRFLAAGLLDRLHLTVAPVILGSGRPSFVLPEADCIDDGLRVRWTVYHLGEDVLLDVPLDGARPRSAVAAGVPVAGVLSPDAPA